MKFFKFACILLSLLFFSSLHPIFAHMPGQPPYFMINNEYSNTYIVPSNSPYANDPPQDLAPKEYTVNQELSLVIDTARFPQATPDQIKETKFSWDFGDGAIASGLQNTHAYAKPGNYILKIMADDGQTPEPQLFESVLIPIKFNTIVKHTPPPSQSNPLLFFIVAGIVGICPLFVIGILCMLLKPKKVS